MRAITIHQPFASLIAHGVKTYETRGWPTAYRGPILIHAGNCWDSEVESNVRRAWRVLSDRGIPAPGFPGNWDAIDRMLGCVLAIGMLESCIRSKGPANFPALDQLFGDLRTGRHGFRITEVARLERPVKCRGLQKLWTPSSEVLSRVADALPQSSGLDLFKRYLEIPA